MATASKSICFFFYCSLLLVCCCAQQDAALVEAVDSRGREFVVGFMRQFGGRKDGNLTLYLASSKPTQAVLWADQFQDKRNLTPGVVETVFVPGGLMMVKGIENKGILVTADEEISVYVLNQLSSSTDAYLALPTDSNGLNYYVASYSSKILGTRSLFAIIGMKNKTRVRVTPSAPMQMPDGTTLEAGKTTRVKINRLQTFLFESKRNGDLTGTRIESKKPIALLSGHECANVPSTVNFCDHLVEQLPPISRWGTEYVTAPFSRRLAGDIFRIITSQDNTIIKLNNKEAAVKDAGEYLEVSLPSTSYNYVTTSEPSLLVQYCKSTGADQQPTDPFMMLVPPTSHYASAYTISTPAAKPVNFSNYMTVIVEKNETAGLRLDGRAFSKGVKWHTVDASFSRSYSVATIPLATGSHSVHHVFPIIQFAVMLYGYASYDSYGYPGGLRLAELHVCFPDRKTRPGDGIDNDCDGRIDEELRNYRDDDGDDVIDEDLATYPPVIRIPRNATISSCSSVMDFDFLGRASVVSVADSCSSVKFTFSDTVERTSCRRRLMRMWLGTDTCGNLDNDTQEIIIDDQVAPNIRAPSHTDATCDTLDNTAVVGFANVFDDCDRKKAIETTFSDAQAGCIVVRTWESKDSCSNVAKPVIQNISMRLDPPTVEVPVDQELRCNQSTDPSTTGRLKTISRTTACGAMKDRSTKVVYSDKETTRSDCQVILTRTWTVINVCGQRWSYPQRILVIANRTPVVRLPTNAYVSCSHISDLRITGQPYVFGNCSPIHVSHSDKFLSCGVERTWVVRDYCGHEVVRHVQIINLKYEFPVLDHPSNTMISCSKSLPDVPSLSDVQVICRDIVVRIDAVRVFENWTGNACARQLNRHLILTDTCSGVGFHDYTITVIDDTRPHLKSAPFNTRATCAQAVNFTDVGEPVVTDDCTTGHAIFEDQLQGMKLTRKWVFEDECGNIGGHVIQTIDIEESPPVMVAPRNVNVICNESIHPDDIGYAVIQRDIDDKCRQLYNGNSKGKGRNINSKLKTSLVYVDQSDRDKCPRTIKRIWTAATFIGHLVTQVQYIAQEIPCVPEGAFPGDNFDNDCDGRIDEEVKNHVDDDGDGRTDEDLAYRPPKIEVVALKIVKGCGVSTAAEGSPKLVFDGRCKLVSLKYTDFDDGNGCPREFRRVWNVSDNCGNIVRKTQMIEVRQGDPPRLTAPSNTVATCDDYRNTTVTGTAVVTGGCEGLLTLSADFVDKTNGCTVFRTWIVSDSCGNTAPSVVQEIKIKMAAPSVDSPGDIRLTCRDELAPRFTGRPYVRERTLCDTSASLPSAVINYVDSSEIVSVCQTRVTRRWAVSDVCGNSVVTTQNIIVAESWSPIVAFPVDTKAVCSDIFNPAVTGIPQVTNNCSEVRVRYEDEVRSCHVERTWMVETRCGEYRVNYTQIIRLDYEPFPIEPFPDLVLSCEEQGMQPPFKQPVYRLDCNRMTVTGLSVNFTDVSKVETSCHQVIRRLANVSDSCGNVRLFSYSVTYQDVTAPSLLAPRDRTVTCAKAIALREREVSDTSDACNAVSMLYEDNLERNVLLRTWQAVDDCGNRSPFVTQRLALLDREIKAKFPADSVVPCNGSTLPENTGFPILVRNISRACYSLGVSKPSIKYVDVVNALGCPAVVTRTWTVSTVFSKIEKAQRIEVEAPPCRVSKMIPADGVDNDCDDRVDEEVRDFTDNDGDGLIDEDLLVEPMVVVYPADYNFSSCSLSVEAAHLGMPTVSLVATKCQPVTITHEDDVLDRQCRRDIVRQWLVVDSCGNLARGTQAIIVNDKTAPVLSAPPTVHVSCGQLSDTSTTGNPQVNDDCQKSNVTVWFEDTPNGCSFDRRWFADDGCGGMSSVVQKIVPVLEAGHVRLPDHKTLSCGESPHPNITGRPVADPRNLCNSRHILPVNISYEDSVGVVSVCRSVVERTWIFSDVCGNFSAFQQRITIKTQIQPFLTFPSDRSISCQGGQYTDEPIRPQFTQNCLDMNVTFVDFIGDCSISRKWTIMDECGRLVRSQTQLIRVKHSNPNLLPYRSFNVTARCNDEVEKPSFNASEHQKLCHGIVVPALSVTSSDVTVSGDQCKREVFRSINITGNCADDKFLNQTIIYVDREGPRVDVPSNIDATCELAYNLELAGVAVARDDCNNAVVTHSDRLSGSTLVRTWSAVDSCGNTAGHFPQYVTLVEQAPLVVYPADRVQECGLLFTPNVTGRPRIEQDISLMCFTLGGSRTTVNYDDTVNGTECNQTIKRTWRIETFLGHNLTHIQTINIIPRPCRTTAGEPMDGVDNDCDDRVDEEAKNSIDDDGDGRIDEDLATIPVYILPSGVPPVSTTCRVVNDSDSFVQPSYTVANGCSPVHLSYQDVPSTSNSACTKSVTRKWSAADICGNTDTSEQMIQIVDRTAPDVDVVPVVDMSCNEVDAKKSNGIAYSDDCSADDVNMTCSYNYHSNYTVDGFYGCIATRQCLVQDFCGNRATQFQQIIRLKPRSLATFSVKFPDDVATCGGTSIHPDATGQPISNGYVICNSTVRSDPEIRYDDTVVSSGKCRDVIKRRWVVKDVCGQETESRAQTVSVVHNLAAFVTFPTNTTVKCDHGTDPNRTGWPTIRANCSDLRFVYSDGVSGCSVSRVWNAVDVCGNVVATATQHIDVVHSYSHLRYRKTLHLSCDGVAPETYPHVGNRSCHGIVVRGPYVSYTVLDRRGDSCNRIVRRSITVSSSCGVLRRHTQAVRLSDRTAPLMQHLSHVNLSCSDAVNLTLSGRPLASDACSFVNVTFSDRLVKDKIYRTWSALDGCGNSAKSHVQRIDLIDYEPTLSPIADRSIYCNESTMPRHTGRPTITQDVSLSCRRLGVAAATVTYEDVVDGIACPRTIRRMWTAASAFGRYQIIQTIEQVPHSLIIEVPPNVLLHDCRASIDPSVTGRSVVSYVSDLCFPAGAPYHYIVANRSQANCKTVLIRHWTANDSCGNVDSALQTIEVVDTSPPTIDAPKNVVASCSNYQNETHVGSPSTLDDCSRVNTTYTDELVGCRVMRTWHARDECGNSAASEAQVIELRPGTPEVYIPGNVNVTCDDSLSASTTGVPLVIESRLCGWNKTATVTIDHVDTSRELENCQTNISRRWSATDICGSSVVGVQTIIVLHKPPSMEIPTDTAVACRLTSDLSIAGEANVISSCRSTHISYSDSLDGSVLLRSWTVTDNCSRAAAPQAQRISLREDPPALRVPSNVTIKCNENSHPNNTGWAELERDIDTSCFRLGGAATVVGYVDVASGGKCPAFIVRRWTASTFLGHIVEGEQWITLGCQPTLAVPADGDDNDCDGTADEEIHNYIDDDGDGLVDEDLRTHPPVIEIPDDATFSSCRHSTEPNRTGRATVSSVSGSCGEVTIHHEDREERSECQTRIERRWVGRDSCGNVVNLTQVITVNNKTPPVLSLPEDRAANCAELNDVRKTGSARGNADCGGNVKVWYSDQLNGCSVVRHWHGRDQCDNEAEVKRQAIRLTIEVPTFILPINTTVSCFDKIDSSVVGRPRVTTSQLCGWNGTATVNVSHVDEIEDGANCDRTLKRRWMMADICGNTDTGVQSVVIEHDVATLDVPTDLVCSCGSVTDFNVVGHASVNRSCSQTNVTHEDKLDGSVLLRTWMASDVCGRHTLPHVQRITLKEPPPVLIAPSNVTILCHETAHPNVTGRPLLQQAIDERCVQLGGTATVIDYSDKRNRAGCPSYILRYWTATDFLGQTSRVLQVISLGCNLSNTVPADRKDNDCDGQVDEEARNFIDDDGDQLIDEDLSTTPPEIQPPSSIYLTSCGDPITPRHTGHPVVLVSSESCNSTTVTYNDKVTRNACEQNITREWVVVDSCGNINTGVQTILVEDRTVPTLSPPANRTVTCSEYRSMTAVGDGSALSLDDCDGDPTVTYKDELRGCVVWRTWSAHDECGNVAASEVQLLQLRGEVPSVDFPGDMSVSCLSSTASVVTGYPNVSRSDLDLCNAANAITVTHTNTTTQLENCNMRIARKWRVSDVCGSEKDSLHVQNITVLYQSPIIKVPANATSNCDGAGNLDLVGRAIVTQSCRTVNVTFDDKLDGDVLARRWTGIDSCGISVSQMQYIKVLEEPPRLTVPQNITISCHQSFHPKSSGWAQIERDLSQSCFHLGGNHSATVVDYEDDTSGFDCPRHILRQWRATTFLGSSSHANQLITLISCNVSETVPEDRVDNDCDSKVDEEVRNFADDDGDGLIDEDLATVPLELETLPSVYLTSCRDPTSQQHTGHPRVLFVAKQCAPVDITHSDKRAIESCRREIERVWMAKDACGNVHVTNQSIVVNDRTAPSLSVPKSRSVTCSEYKNSSVRDPVVSHDDCDGVVSTEYKDEFRDCVVLRTWTARDECDNTAPPQFQELVLRINAPTVRFPGDVSVTCATSMTPQETGKPDVNDPDLCGWNRDIINIVSVSHDDTETKSGNCKQAITRTWRVSDICGHEVSHVQNILTTQDNSLRAQGLRTASVWYVTILISICFSYVIFTY